MISEMTCVEKSTSLLKSKVPRNLSINRIDHDWKRLEGKIYVIANRYIF
jgi:hypothetical protein